MTGTGSFQVIYFLFVRLHFENFDKKSRYCNRERLHLGTVADQSAWLMEVYLIIKTETPYSV